MNRTRISSILGGLLLTTAAYFAIPVNTASAQVFNPHLIITDEVMRDSRSMTYDEVKAFLDSKGGLSAIYDIDPVDGLLKNTPQLIVDAAARYQVNPKYILVLLQKEAGLVEQKVPNQHNLNWATGYAVCDSCSRLSPKVAKYKGFAKQLDAGAGWVKWYYERNATNASFAKVGVPRTTLDGDRVVPVNLATAALYTYTPHIHGNRLLFSIWNRWFVQEGNRELFFPDGTLIKNEDNGAYAVVQNGKVRPILSLSVLITRFNAESAVELDNETFEYLHETNPGEPMRFPDNALLQLEDGAIYLLANRTRRKIASPEAFRAIGFNPEEVETATLADIAEYPEGPAITSAEVDVLPRLVQDPRNGGIYLVVAGAKNPLLDKALLKANFSELKIERGTAKSLDALPTGAPVKINDGALVKTANDAKVYVIAGGLRRAIPDEATFVGYGYNFKRVMTVNQKLIDLHPMGEPLRLPQLEEKSEVTNTVTQQS